MTFTLRMFLIIGSALLLVYVVRKLRKSALEIQDSIFWVGLAVLLIVIAIFPDLVGIFARFFGFASTSNFVYFCGIVVMLARVFTQDIKIANLKKKLTAMTQTIALKEHESKQ